jgi:acetyl-CoA carboxylase carboxyltransferase component
MEGRTLAIGAYRTKLDDDFQVATDDPEEASVVRRGMQDVEDRIAADMDPVRAASQMDVDEIVTPRELRPWLEVLIAMAYQSTGYRRVKNPRIWSLHDLRTLTGGA